MLTGGTSQECAITPALVLSSQEINSFFGGEGGQIRQYSGDHTGARDPVWVGYMQDKQPICSITLVPQERNS